MEVTMMEHDAYLELRRRLCGLSVAVTELYRKVAPPTREKWLSTQEVCEALHISVSYTHLTLPTNSLV